MVHSTKITKPIKWFGISYLRGLEVPELREEDMPMI
jgi:hypothetical protein